MMLDATVEAEVMEGVALVTRTPKMMKILDAVSAVYGVGKLDLMSTRRFPHFVEAREAFCWLCRKLTIRTYHDIGRFLGRRDHATVWAAVRRVERKFAARQAKLVEVAHHLGIDASEVSL